MNKKVLHISSECYPAAKAGGMGDVVGALPIYLPRVGYDASVVIPKYANKWFKSQSYKQVAKGSFLLGAEKVKYTVQTLKKGGLQFPFYCIDIPGKFDRESIYLGADGHGYSDEPQRNITFQTAVCDWLLKGKHTFDVLHCHDHMTGLILFMLKYCTRYQSLSEIPTVFTIHNGQYKGEFDWQEVAHLLPPYKSKHDGVLDWDHKINSLATAVKCAWKVNTVSPQYMKEIRRDAGRLTQLYQMEGHKCSGILNGVDVDLWDPSTDSFLDHKLVKSWKTFKSKNKRALLQQFDLKSRRPLIGFIGRLTDQKGADLLADAIDQLLSQSTKVSFVILGTGDKQIEKQLKTLEKKYPRSVKAYIAYDEAVARLIYAGSDYLIMPSRFEPCGLNQLFAMRYGSIPIVATVGGLVDTVPDINIGGNGITFSPNSSRQIHDAVIRSIDLYDDKSAFAALIDKISSLDYSWEYSAKEYATLYLSIIS